LLRVAVGYVVLIAIHAVHQSLVSSIKLLLSLKDSHVRPFGHRDQGLRVLNQQFHALVRCIVVLELTHVVRVLPVSLNLLL
jgi:hypothetical protein